jgi:DNA-binding NarL/FixJ family response regulator
MSGYETCHELRNLYGETLPLVLLSGTRVDALDRIAGLLLGADDYIVKPFDPGELLARARLLLRRQKNGAEHRNGHSPSLDALTPREREVLDLLAEGRSQDAIAQELFITPKTVATHIQRVLAKLEVHSRAQAVAVALRQSGDDFVGHYWRELEPV